MVNNSSDICIFWGDWQLNFWWSCMTSSEWASWVQAIGVLLTLAITLLLPTIRNYFAKRRYLKIAKSYGALLRKKLKHLERSSEILRMIGTPLYSDDPANCIDESMLKFNYFSIPDIGQHEAIAFLDTDLFVHMMEALGDLAARKIIIENLKSNKSFISNMAGGFGFAHDQASKLDDAIRKLRTIADRIGEL